MTEVVFRSAFDVTLTDYMGNDQRVCQAARVSTLGADSLDGATNPRLINFLMKNRHGSPFEHVVFTWFIHAPVFVWREFMRHRWASFNEESGRYKTLDPIFYTPNPLRPLVQVGKPGAYTFERGDMAQRRDTEGSIEQVATLAYREYEYMLERGVAREVARMVLPVSIYSTAFVTMNARGLMNFLSLRRCHENSTYPSFPQYEIEQVARKMEEHFRKVAPLTYQAFVDHGSVQP